VAPKNILEQNARGGKVTSLRLQKGLEQQAVAEAEAEVIMLHERSRKL